MTGTSYFFEGTDKCVPVTAACIVGSFLLDASQSRDGRHASLHWQVSLTPHSDNYQFMDLRFGVQAIGHILHCHLTSGIWHRG